MRKARIVYDRDGTDELVVEAERLSVQLWTPRNRKGGKALIKAYNGGRKTRAILIAHCHLIDITIVDETDETAAETAP